MDEDLTWVIASAAVGGNVAGLIGTVLLTVPFLRQDRLHRVRSAIEKGRRAARTAGTRDVFERARSMVEWEQLHWDPLDFRLVTAGLALLFLSYLLNSIPPLVELFAAP